MSQQTAIEWSDVTWNPVHGCSVVSPGCAHCYAATLSLRYGHTKKPWTPANVAENVILKPHKLREPLSNAKPWQGLGAAAAAAGMTGGKLVFVNSMSDLFHEQVPDDFIARVFAVMGDAKKHTFQVLTKRPERMSTLLRSWRFCKAVMRHADSAWTAIAYHDDCYLDNVWLGTSIENRRFVDRADWLRQTPAAVRFISAEPLLGSLVRRPVDPTDLMAALEASLDLKPWLDLADIDWLIAGGESGKGARRLDLDWMRDLRDACSAVGVAYFVKQLGGARPGTKLEDLPEDLRIREFPRAVAAVEASA